MSKNDKNLFHWHRPLRDSNPISQQSSTPVGLPAGEKAAEIGRVSCGVLYFFEQIGLEGVVQTGRRFGSQGHPRSLQMVQFDRRQNFLYFPFPGHNDVQTLSVVEHSNSGKKVLIRFDSRCRIDFFDSIRFGNLINLPLVH